MNEIKLPMKTFFKGNLHIIGSSHINKEAEQIVKEMFVRFNPEILLLELDAERFNQIESMIEQNLISENNFDMDAIRAYLQSTMDPDLIDPEEEFDPLLDNIKDPQKDKDVYQIMDKIRQYQWDLAQKKDILLGNEFFISIILAKQKKIPVYLIDLSMGEIFDKLGGISEEEIAKLISEISSYDSEEHDNDHASENEGTTHNLDDEYEELMENLGNQEYLTELTGKFQEEFPEIYDVFITSRNKHMADKILEIYKNNSDKKILTFIGAGHFSGIAQIIEDYEKNSNRA